VITFLVVNFALFPACNKAPEAPPDHPRLTPNVRMQDVTFHSAALRRGMPYRVILPAKIATGTRLPVVYLLHGGGGGYRDWTNYSDVARFAERSLILVMPEGESSYYINAAARPKDRFEDYIVNDLIADVESRFPAARDRANRSIVGVSMGGIGAVTLALKHHDLFVFAGGSVLQSMCRAVPSRSRESGSTGRMPPFLVLGEVTIGGKTIRLFWRELPILRARHISFSPAAIRKVCFQLTRSSPRCSRAMASSMNSMQAPADTTGTSGTVVCRSCFGV
jgi:hypothetical protein